jgi:hypothetical protein
VCVCVCACMYAQHPFLAMMVRADVIKDKGMAVVSRRVERRGSLKDLIYAVRTQARTETA